MFDAFQRWFRPREFAVAVDAGGLYACGLVFRAGARPGRQDEPLMQHAAAAPAEPCAAPRQKSVPSLS